MLGCPPISFAEGGSPEPLSDPLDVVRRQLTSSDKTLIFI
jgi:hypothetical protein